MLLSINEISQNIIFILNSEYIIRFHIFGHKINMDNSEDYTSAMIRLDVNKMKNNSCITV